MRRRDIGFVFDALGDATRRDLVAQLGSLGSATPTQLAQHLPISRQAISKHLGLLAHAGLVSIHRHGRETVYTLTPERLTDAVSWMTQVGAEWDARLDSLRTQLKRRPR
jgi:DNA-binding transcriptional ArsR family regulator